MHIALKKTAVVLTSRWFTAGGTLASIFAFMMYLHERSSVAETSLHTIIFFLVAIVAFASAAIYSIAVRAENLALRDIALFFNEINEIYRDALHELFGGNSPAANPTNLLAREEKVLTSVCQRIEKIFTRVMFGRPCMVTVKLVLEENGRYFAHTYVRSETECVRDKPKKIQYEINTGQNTAFDQARLIRPDGKHPHFFSPNLKNEGDKYKNQRQEFSRFYKSALVVPIRGHNKGREGTEQEFDLVGFLCVDTTSVNWLNNGYHLQIMTSLANQMYNFMSLMRGKYTVSSKQKLVAD